MRTSHTLYFVSICLLFVLSLACKQDTDCVLNGVCTNGACVCDPGWTSENCSQLSLGEAPLIGAYGYSPNVSSWGGLPVFVDGAYHLYVTEMVDGCGLCTWQHNSHVVHAVSSSLTGPYKKTDQAIGIWSHNPQVVVDNTGGKATYVIFHIGNGGGGDPKVCNATESRKQSQMPEAGGWLHYSDSVEGPWTPINPDGYNGNTCNNPAPIIFANGSVLVVCAPWGKTWFALSAPSFKGPYSDHPFSFGGNGGEGIWEDPFIWQDHRNNFHMLNHAFVGGGSAYAIRVGGYAYSEDGKLWVKIPGQPFTNKVEHTNGQVVPYTTRERPKLYFDPSSGRPLALFNGVGGVPMPYGDKDKCGVDWTFTLVQPVN